MQFAKPSDIAEIVELYRLVIDEVNKTDIRLGWNIEEYPSEEFVIQAVSDGQMVIQRQNGQLVAAAVVNHTVNDEYDEIAWQVSGPKRALATIHALAVHPACRGGKVSGRMLADIEDYCRQQGDKAIHLDVIDTNVPAYKLYLRNGYTEAACISMFYSVVGTRQFWMMERVL